MAYTRAGSSPVTTKRLYLTDHWAFSVTLHRQDGRTEWKCMAWLAIVANVLVGQICHTVCDECTPVRDRQLLCGRDCSAKYVRNKIRHWRRSAIHLIAVCGRSSDTNNLPQGTLYTFHFLRIFSGLTWHRQNTLPILKITIICVALAFRAQKGLLLLAKLKAIVVCRNNRTHKISHHS